MHDTETTKRRPPARSKARREMSTVRLKERFLEAYEKYGTVTSACRVVELSRDTPYRWRQQDSEFDEAFENSRNVVADGLEAECIRRAHEGSDLLLIFLLKGLKPERYQERRNVNLATPAVQKFFERAGQVPLGPPALTGVIDEAPPGTD